MDGTTSATTPVGTDDGADWSSEADAVASMQTFAAELAESTRYRVDRIETTGVGPGSIAQIATLIIDLEAEDVGGIQRFEASSPELVEQYFGESDVDLDDLEVHQFLDYSGDGVRTLMTYPSEWEGRWLEVTDDTELSEGLTVGAALAEVGPADTVLGFVEVTGLAPTEFVPSTGELLFDVPPDIALNWMSARVGLLLTENGLDLSHAGAADAVARARPVEGGIAIEVDLTPFYASIPGYADLMGSTSTSVSITVHDLGTSAEIVVPDEDAISTEPWE